MARGRQFYQLLKPLHRKLWFATLIKNLQIFLLCCSGIWLVWMVISRIVLISGSHIFLPFAYFLALTFTVTKIYLERPTWKDTVNVMNDFVPDDLVLTAYSVLGKDGDLERLIVRDAEREVQDNIEKALKRKTRTLSPFLLGTALLFFALGILSYYFPNDIMLANREREEERKAVIEFKKELKETLDLEDEDVKKLMAEIEEAGSAEEIAEILEQAYRELELAELQAENKLHDWQKELEEAGFHELAENLGANNLESVMDELINLQKEFSHMSTAEQNALTTVFGENFSRMDVSELKQSISEAMESASRQMALQKRKETIADLASSLNTTLTNRGLERAVGQLEQRSSTNQMARANQQSGLNETNGTGQSGTGDQGEPSQFPAGSEGQGNEPGNSGNASGTGQGINSPAGSSKDGTGSGGSGQGRGAGFGTDSRLLSIPEYVDGQINIEEDFGPIDSGDPLEERYGNGPVASGKIRPYEEVFSQYDEAVRKSMERIQLPKELENIIKNYFSNVKP